MPATAGDTEGNEGVQRSVAEQPTFTPFTQAPVLTNPDEVREALRREYPPLLRDAGIGGTADVFVFVDEEGRVRNARVDESSGHRPLDAAALRVVDLMRFRPGLNRDKAVPVWISLPVTFEIRDARSEAVEREEAVVRERLEAAQREQAVVRERLEAALEELGRARAELEATAEEKPESPAVEAEPSSGPRFTPYTVAPRVRNVAEVQKALERLYPAELRDAGIGGTADVWFFISPSGSVRDVRLNTPSGHRALDQAALELADEMEFAPALNRDEPVEVWISLPITFQVR